MSLLQSKARGALFDSRRDLRWIGRQAVKQALCVPFLVALQVGALVV